LPQKIFENLFSNIRVREVRLYFLASSWKSVVLVVRPECGVATFTLKPPTPPPLSAHLPVFLLFFLGEHTIVKIVFISLQQQQNSVACGKRVCSFFVG